jgi:hypothetical protein
MNPEGEGHGMDEGIRALLDQIPEKPPRSKLEPHLEVIRALRRKGRTYQEIAQFFGEHLQVTVAASTIHAFVQVRARRRQHRPQVELPPPAGLGMETAPAANGSAIAGIEGDVMERIEALKRRRPPGKPEKPRFEYDESEPLQRLVPGTK